MTLLYLSLLFHFFKMGVAAARSNKKARVGNKATCYWLLCLLWTWRKYTQKPHWRPLFRALQRSAFGEERQTKKVLGFSPIKCDELPTHCETLENRPPRDRIASSLEFKMFIFWSGRPSPKALHWAFQVFDIEMFSLILFGMNEQSLFQTIFALFLLTNCLHLLCLTFSFWRKKLKECQKRETLFKL